MCHTFFTQIFIGIYKRGDHAEQKNNQQGNGNAVHFAVEKVHKAKQKTGPSNIKASTLLIWGENDTASPLWMAKVMEEKIKDCGLVVMPGLSHWNFVENPVQTDAILNSFLLGGK